MAVSAGETSKAVENVLGCLFNQTDYVSRERALRCSGAELLCRLSGAGTEGGSPGPGYRGGKVLCSLGVGTAYFKGVLPRLLRALDRAGLNPSLKKVRPGLTATSTCQAGLCHQTTL